MSVTWNHSCAQNDVDYVQARFDGKGHQVEHQTRKKHEARMRNRTRHVAERLPDYND